MTARLIGLAVYLALAAPPARAQELGIDVNGGLQGTVYRLQQGRVEQLPGGSIGLSYSFRVGNRWRLITGLAMGVYRTRATLGDSAVFNSDQVDDAGSAFQYRVKAAGYAETQQFFAAGIPLELQYHTPGAHTRWYVTAGGRALFPLTASIRQTADRLSLSGYYPDYHVEVSDLPQHGFGTVHGWSASGTSGLKPAAILSFATGLSFRLSAFTRFYTGLYIDYGLTALSSGGDSLSFASYNPAGISAVKVNSVLKMPASGSMSLLSYGLQLGIAFGYAKAKPAGRQGEEDRQTAATGIGDQEADFIGTPILFGPVDETALSDIMKAHLDSVAAILIRHPGVRISVVGHICNSESQTETPEIGSARANAVARYLRTRGIRRGRIDVGSVPGSDPVVPNNPAANYRKRRAVIALE